MDLPRSKYYPFLKNLKIIVAFKLRAMGLVVRNCLDQVKTTKEVEVRGKSPKGQRVKHFGLLWGVSGK
jgi:hypothetical protein